MKCERSGCEAESIICQVVETLSIELLCREHAVDAGYCPSCGVRDCDCSDPEYEPEADAWVENYDA